MAVRIVVGRIAAAGRRIVRHIQTAAAVAARCNRRTAAAAVVGRTAVDRRAVAGQIAAASAGS